MPCELLCVPPLAPLPPRMTALSWSASWRSHTPPQCPLGLSLAPRGAPYPTATCASPTPRPLCPCLHPLPWFPSYSASTQCSISCPTPLPASPPHARPTHLSAHRSSAPVCYALCPGRWRAVQHDECCSPRCHCPQSACRQPLWTQPQLQAAPDPPPCLPLCVGASCALAGPPLLGGNCGSNFALCVSVWPPPLPPRSRLPPAPHGAPPNHPSNQRPSSMAGPRAHPEAQRRRGRCPRAATCTWPHRPSCVVSSGSPSGRIRIPGGTPTPPPGGSAGAR